MGYSATPRNISETDQDIQNLCAAYANTIALRPRDVARSGISTT